jgi:hypothetical protein
MDGLNLDVFSRVAEGGNLRAIETNVNLMV